MINQKKLENFMEKTTPSRKPKKELLKQYREDFIELYVKGYTLQQIVIYVKETYRIKTSRQTISEIINSFKEKNNECE